MAKFWFLCVCAFFFLLALLVHFYCRRMYSLLIWLWMFKRFPTSQSCGVHSASMLTYFYVFFCIFRARIPNTYLYFILHFLSVPHDADEAKKEKSFTSRKKKFDFFFPPNFSSNRLHIHSQCVPFSAIDARICTNGRKRNRKKNVFLCVKHTRRILFKERKKTKMEFIVFVCIATNVRFANSKWKNKFLFTCLVPVASCSTQNFCLHK